MAGNNIFAATQAGLFCCFSVPGGVNDHRCAIRLREGLIDSVETGIPDGAEKVAVIATAQYYVQELARRTQDRQTKSIIAMTKAITIMTAIVTFMTAVIMVATLMTIWPGPRG